MDKMMERFDDYLEKSLKIFEEEAEDLWNKSINDTFEDLYNEAVGLYDSLIEKYYKYETKSYYRHHVGIGTGTGENLYYGKQIELKTGESPELSINFSGEDMDGYKHNSTDEVLSMVMHGIRGVPSKGWWTTWSGDYDGEYFSVGGVNISRAFDIFDKEFDRLSVKIFRKNVNKIKKSGKYRFFK